MSKGRSNRVNSIKGLYTHDIINLEKIYKGECYIVLSDYFSRAMPLVAKGTVKKHINSARNIQQEIIITDIYASKPFLLNYLHNNFFYKKIQKNGKYVRYVLNHTVTDSELMSYYDTSKRLNCCKLDANKNLILIIDEYNIFTTYDEAFEMKQNNDIYVMIQSLRDILYIQYRHEYSLAYNVEFFYKQNSNLVKYILNKLDEEKIYYKRDKESIQNFIKDYIFLDLEETRKMKNKKE